MSTTDIVDAYRLSFNIGPVQEFVAQARRTRDLWAGSWLLSFLSENALVACEYAGGKAIIPHRSQQDSYRITSTRTAIGGIPNRFEMAFGSKEIAEQAGEQAAAAFELAWNAIADFVESRYVKPFTAKNGTTDTETIWKRQVESFWEVSWVVTESPGPRELAGLVLNQRKQFRAVPATEEPGTKCSMITDLQELSGIYGRDHWTTQRAFWKDFRGDLNQLDLKENEKLSAIGFIKRMFPDVVDDFVKAVQTQRDDVDPAAGAPLGEQSRWPSLGFFAALPWLDKVNRDDNARGFAQDLSQLAHKPPGEPRDKGYWNSEQIPQVDFGLGDWAKIDAPVWHASGLANNEAEIDRRVLRQLQQKQRQIYDAVDAAPVPYYALLLADGDSMGDLLAAMDQPTDLSRRLNTFCSNVKRVIHQQVGNGRVVYAGGDDVFALLTAASALQAADQLHQEYANAFDGSGAEEQATLSVSIVFAHWRFPLKRTIRIAHDLLDNVAKRETGRNSLSLALLQGSGLRAVWSAPWSVIRGDETTQDASVSLQEMIERFDANVVSEVAAPTAAEGVDNQPIADSPGRALPYQDNAPTFNATYLYLLRRQFSQLMPNSADLPGKYQSTGAISPNTSSDNTRPVNNVLLELAHSEYRRRFTKKQREATPPDQTREPIKQLMTLSQQWTRVKTDDGQFHVSRRDDKFSFDGWKIARFLKQIKDGKLADHE